MAAIEDLHVNRDLLEPNFDGYKLSLDRLPLYKHNFEKGIDVAKSTEDQYSYQHICLFSLHNHLIADPWVSSAVYLVDQDWTVRRLAIDGESQLDSGVNVYNIPAAGDKRLVPGRYNVTLNFASKGLAVLADGAGSLYLLATEERSSETHMWKALYFDKPFGEGHQFCVVDSTSHAEGETQRVECLLSSIDEIEGEEKKKNQSPFVSVLHWVTLFSVDLKTWTLERTRRLEGVRPFDCAAVERKTGAAIYLASQQPFQLVSDSIKPIHSHTDEDWEVVGNQSGTPQYTWSQSNDDVSVQFTVAESVCKADIYLSVTADHLDFGIKNTQVLLKGQLLGRVDVEACTWTISGQRVGLTLSKAEQKTWPLVVVGDHRGELTLDPELVAQIHERLAQFTTDNPNADPGEEKKPYNTQELEDCDTNPDDDSVLQRIDGETHAETHKVNIGNHQWLFNITLHADKMPAICLRYDVDGLLWQPEPPSSTTSSPWHHVASFNAFGYVQASKQQKKFSASCPDCSYAVICDCTRHIYIYRQNAPISSPLRNRKTGRQVNSVAKQHVVALETTSEIIGLVAANKWLVVATEEAAHVIKVDPEA